LIALYCALLIVLGNASLYMWRAHILRHLLECDVPEPLGLIDAVRAFAQECIACGATVILWPIGWLMPSCASGRGNRGPLVLVHGWGLNRGCFWLLRRRLLRDGWGPVCCFDYRSFDALRSRAPRHLERAAEQLRVFLQHLGDCGPLTVIGHGLGGFVLRFYLRRYPAPNVRRIVMLGTPHLGTELARPQWRASAKLRPGSTFLTRLNAGDRVPQQYDAIAIHSSFDATVVPPSNAEYPGAFNIQVRDVGHNALLFSSKVYRLLLENLNVPLR
jgi:triacylglycerol lipase